MKNNIRAMYTGEKKYESCIILEFLTVQTKNGASIYAVVAIGKEIKSCQLRDLELDVDINGCNSL